MIPAANRALLAQSFRDSFKLRHANSRLNIAHPKIPTEFLMDEPSLFIEAQIAQIATSLRELLVVGQHHSAFPASDMLVWVKAHCRNVTERADRPPLIGLACCSAASSITYNPCARASSMI